MELAEAEAAILAGIKDVMATGKWAEMLDALARMPNYSLRNIVLAASQIGGWPAGLAGYKQWQERFDRQVIKGERAIRIFAPVTKKIAPVEGEVAVPSEGQAAVDSVRRIVGWRLVPVFELSQTEGPPLPTVAPPLEGTAPVEVLAAIRAEVAEAGFAIAEYERRSESAYGSVDLDRRVINVASNIAPLHQAKTLLHELGHGLMHTEAQAQQRSQRKFIEVEAESFAYVACSRLGLDTASYSFGYVAAWGSELIHGGEGAAEDLGALITSVNRAVNRAGEVAGGIEERVAIHSAEVVIEPVGPPPFPRRERASTIGASRER